MAISTRGRYCLRILVLMASQPQGQVFPKYEIALAEDLSCAYVQQLMITLRAAGLVNSHRGKVGGFTLARAPEKTTVAEVLKATEGDIVPAPCLGNETCQREATCSTRPVWVEAAKMLDEFFSAVTIADLVEGRVDADSMMAKSL